MSVYEDLGMNIGWNIEHEIIQILNLLVPIVLCHKGAVQHFMIIIQNLFS